MGAKARCTDAQITQALEECNGVISAAADKIGMKRSAMQARLTRNPKLAEVRQSCKEKIVDSAETGLFAAVKARKPWAIKLVLSRLGKDRGYGNSLQVETSHSGRIVLVLPDDGRGNDPDGSGKNTNGTAGATVRGIPE